MTLFFSTYITHLHQSRLRQMWEALKIKENNYLHKMKGMIL